MSEDLIDVIGAMYREVDGGYERRISKSFPREHFTEICEIVSYLNELNSSKEKNMFCSLSVSYRLCRVEFALINGNF